MEEILHHRTCMKPLQIVEYLPISTGAIFFSINSYHPCWQVSRLHPSLFSRIISFSSLWWLHPPATHGKTPTSEVWSGSFMIIFTPSFLQKKVSCPLTCCATKEEMRPFLNAFWKDLQTKNTNKLHKHHENLTSHLLYQIKRKKAQTRFSRKDLLEFQPVLDPETLKILTKQTQVALRVNKLNPFKCFLLFVFSFQAMFITESSTLALHNRPHIHHTLKDSNREVKQLGAFPSQGFFPALTFTATRSKSSAASVLRSSAHVPLLEVRNKPTATNQAAFRKKNPRKYVWGFIKYLRTYIRLGPF